MNMHCPISSPPPSSAIFCLVPSGEIIKLKPCREFFCFVCCRGTTIFVKRLQCRLEVLTPGAATKPWLCREQWRWSTAVIKNFRCGKFASGVRIRHAVVNKNVFCFMKYFNPRVFQSLLTFESVKSLWKHNERKQFKFHLIYSVLRISQCVSR